MDKLAFLLLFATLGGLGCTLDAEISEPGIYRCTWDKTPGEIYRFDSEADTTDVRYPILGAEGFARFLDLDRDRFFTAIGSDGWHCRERE